MSPGQRLRIEVYRRLARIRRPDRLEDFRQELRDRFGPLPETVEWLLRLAELRILAARWQVATIHLEKRGRGRWAIAMPTRSSAWPGAVSGRLRVVDDASAYLRLATGR